MRILEIQQADIETLFDIQEQTRDNQMLREALAKQDITPESIAEGIRSTLKGWLCEVDDLIVGFAMGNGETGEMVVVAVLPEHENKGIGKQLVERVEEWLFSQGHNRLWLLENPDTTVRAHGFYRKLGWVDTGEKRDGDTLLRKPAPDPEP